MTGVDCSGPGTLEVVPPKQPIEAGWVEIGPEGVGV